MQCANCNSKNGEFFLFCLWKCWNCGSYTSSCDNDTMRAYVKQKRKYSSDIFPNLQLQAEREG